MYIAYVDVETSGLNYDNDDIWQIGIVIEDQETGKAVDAANIKMQVKDESRITPELLDLLNVTKEQLTGYQSREQGFKEFIEFLTKYTDPTNRNDSLIFCGYNIAGFDMYFIRKLFWKEFKHLNLNINNYIDYHVIDVLQITQLFLLTGSVDGSNYLTNCKLKSMCKIMEIEFDDEKAHDAMYDVVKTRELFKVLSDKVSFN